jgi:plasmid stabilization system protein ParE
VRIVFSALAKADVRAVLHATAVQFGPLQVRTHRAAIASARKRLQENPQLGHHRDGLPPEGRLLHISEPGRPASHFFLYRLNAAKNRVEVLRLLHEAMDIPQYWPGKAT